MPRKLPSTMFAYQPLTVSPAAASTSSVSCFWKASLAAAFTRASSAWRVARSLVSASVSVPAFAPLRSSLRRLALAFSSFRSFSAARWSAVSAYAEVASDVFHAAAFAGIAPPVAVGAGSGVGAGAGLGAGAWALGAPPVDAGAAPPEGLISKWSPGSFG
jgi:hypothetical protein